MRGPTLVKRALYGFTPIFNLRLHADLQTLAPGEALRVAALARHPERDRLVSARAGPRVPHARVRHAPALHLDEHLHDVLASRRPHALVPARADERRRGGHDRLRLPSLRLGPPVAV